jgi:hypothetical protein
MQAHVICDDEALYRLWTLLLELESSLEAYARHHFRSIS